MSGSREIDLEELFDRSADSRLLERRRGDELGLPPIAAPASSTPARFGPESMVGDGVPLAAPRGPLLRVSVLARPDRELIPGAVVTVVAEVADEGDTDADDVTVRLTIPPESEAIAGSFARDEAVLDDGEALLGEGLRIGTVSAASVVRFRFTMRVLPGTEPIDVAGHAAAPGVPAVAAPALRLTRRSGHTAYDAPRPFFELETDETDDQPTPVAAAPPQQRHAVDAVVDEPAAPHVAPPEPKPEPQCDAQIVSEPVSQALVLPDIETQSDVPTRSDVETQPDVQLGSDVEKRPDVESGPEPDLEPLPEASTEARAELQPTAFAESGLAAQSESESSSPEAAVTPPAVPAVLSVSNAPAPPSSGGIRKPRVRKSVALPQTAPAPNAAASAAVDPKPKTKTKRKTANKPVPAAQTAATPPASATPKTRAKSKAAGAPTPPVVPRHKPASKPGPAAKPKAVAKPKAGSKSDVATKPRADAKLATKSKPVATKAAKAKAGSHLLARVLDADELRALERVFSGAMPHGLAALALLSSVAAAESPLGRALGVSEFARGVAAALPRALIAARMNRPTPQVVTADALGAIRPAAEAPGDDVRYDGPLLVARLSARELDALRAVLGRELDDPFLRGAQLLLAVSPRTVEGVTPHAAGRARKALVAYRTAAGAWLMRVTVRRAVDRRYDPLVAEDGALHDAGRTLVAALREAVS